MRIANLQIRAWNLPVAQHPDHSHRVPTTDKETP
jgi:hypothetical protein